MYVLMPVIESPVESKARFDPRRLLSIARETFQSNDTFLSCEIF
jgi:hypothetical protein